MSVTRSDDQPEPPGPPVRICLAMIVRNEVATMPRLVASLGDHLDLVDEWCIIDTGSDDGTPELVARLLGHLPGRLEHRPWRDFGHNRTELVRLCRSLPGVTHLLLADADMTFSVSDDFRSRLAQQTAPMLLVRVVSDGHEFRMPYLVRNDVDWYYESPTHEYLASSAPVETAPFDDLVVIHHADGGSRSDKYERDRRLLEVRILERPDDVRSVFYLARTLQVLGLGDEAIAMFERRLAMGQWEQEQYVCLREIGIIHAEAGRVAEAAWAWQRAIALRPSRAEAYYRLGKLLNDASLYQPARLWLDLAVELPPTDDELFVERWIESWGVRFEVARARWWTGDHDYAYAVCAELVDRSDVPDDVRAACRSNLELAND